MHRVFDHVMNSLLHGRRCIREMFEMFEMFEMCVCAMTDATRHGI